jgi:hypothetical protein
MAKGSRRPDTPWGQKPPNPRPLDYWKVLTPDGSAPSVAASHHWFENGGHNIQHTVWMVVAPDGDTRTVQDMSITEETDGSITTVPDQGAHGNETPPWRNTLRYGTEGTAQYWEGWLNHGDWTPA